MVRSAVTCRRVAMTRQHYLRLHLGGTGQRLVKVIDFKPQEDPVP